MGFEIGNKLWQLRSKHGRDKLFETSELLWDAACEYFEWCDNNPWVKIDFKGKDGNNEVEIPTQRPYTLSGLCLYLGASESYWRNFRITPNLSSDFLTVITRVEDVIRTLKYEGAVVGTYNANIISRDLGLVDKIEQKSTNLNANLTDVSAAEIKAYRDALDKEF